MKRYLYALLTALFLTGAFGMDIQAQEETASAIIRSDAAIEQLKQAGADASQTETTADERHATYSAPNISQEESEAANGDNSAERKDFTTKNPVTVSISGKIFAPQGEGQNYQTITLTGSLGIEQVIQPQPTGEFRFDNVAAGESYTITVSAADGSYAPLRLTPKKDVTNVIIKAH